MPLRITFCITEVLFLFLFVSSLNWPISLIPHNQNFKWFYGSCDIWEWVEQRSLYGDSAYRVDNIWIVVRILAETRDLSLHHILQFGLGSTHYLIEWVQMAQQSGYKSYRAPPSSTEVKNEWISISIHQYAFMERTETLNFTFFRWNIVTRLWMQVTSSVT
jgi:hypothetical protein